MYSEPVRELGAARGSSQLIKLVTTTWSTLTLLHLPFLSISLSPSSVAFRIYDMDKDGYISNGELFQVLKMMVGNNLKDTQLQQIVDKTIINADKDGDGRISFEEFCAVSDILLLTRILILRKNQQKHRLCFGS